MTSTTGLDSKMDCQSSLFVVAMKEKSVVFGNHCGISSYGLQSSDPPMAFAAADRARARVREEMARKNLNQAEVAGLLEWTESRVSKVLNGRTELGVNELESLCFAVGLTMTEVVRDHGYEFCAEMTPSELRFLERFRAISPIERDALMTLFGVASKTRIEPRRAAEPRTKNAARSRLK